MTKSQKVLRKQINKQLESGVLALIQSKWANPIVLIIKKHSSFQFPVNYQRLKAVTIPNAYSQSRMDDGINILGRVKAFTGLETLRGYRQLPINDERKNKTAITSQHIAHHYTHLPFGL